jgi:hypothetical protein
MDMARIVKHSFFVEYPIYSYEKLHSTLMIIIRLSQINLNEKGDEMNRLLELDYIINSFANIYSQLIDTNVF